MDISLCSYCNSNFNESINYANQALTLARQLMWKKGMAVAYIVLEIFTQLSLIIPQP